jgi:hypothetical protein
MKKDDVQAAAVSAPSKASDERVYVAPEILWEQEFVALAQFSLPPCQPGQTEGCQP